MSAKPETAAPTGRKKIAQHKERSDVTLGHESHNTSSPEGAKEGGELPNGWQLATVGETGRYVNGVAFKPTDWGTEGLPIIRIQNLTDPEKPLNRTTRQVEPVYRIEAGDMLVSWSATLDAFIWDRETAILNQHIFKVIPDETVVDKRFLFYLLKQAISEMIKSEHLHGSTMKHINRGPFLAHHVPLPPMKDQRRIVAEIEKQFTRLEAGVAALRRVQANLKRYRAAVLKAACEGRLVPTEADLAKPKSGSGVSPLGSGKKRQDAASTFETGEALLARILTQRRQNWQGRGKYKEPAAPETANLPPLPEGWTWTNLDAAIVSGPQNGVYLPRELYGRGHPILRIDDYQDGWVCGVDELNKVAADQVTASKYQLLSGDLVINRVNSLTHLGKCLVVRETHAGALFESNMMKAHLAACVNPRYVEFCLRARDGRTRLTSGAKWAVNQASINQEDVKRTPLPLPPLAEQTRIVAEVERRLSVVEELEAVVSANLQRATRLRQSILQKAFTGELV